MTTGIVVDTGEARKTVLRRFAEDIKQAEMRRDAALDKIAEVEQMISDHDPHRESERPEPILEVGSASTAREVKGTFHLNGKGAAPAAPPAPQAKPEPEPEAPLRTETRQPKARTKRLVMDFMEERRAGVSSSEMYLDIVPRLTRGAVQVAIRELVDEGKLEAHGKGRGRRYSLPGEGGAFTRPAGDRVPLKAPGKEDPPPPKRPGRKIAVADGPQDDQRDWSDRIRRELRGGPRTLNGLALKMNIPSREIQSSLNRMLREREVKQLPPDKPSLPIRFALREE